MESKRFISLERAKQLEESIGFLSSYVPVEGEIHHIGPNIDEIDEENTKLLLELGKLNKRRVEIIAALTMDEALNAFKEAIANNGSYDHNTEI